MKLLVVGNGVDIALGYHTRAIDCDNWLKNKAKKDPRTKQQLSYIGDHYKNLFHADLWLGVENNLMKVDDPPKGMTDEKWYSHNLWQFIIECFRDWVDHICKDVEDNNIHPKTKDDMKESKIIEQLLRSSDLIFDFNYTDTFKCHFSIPENKIIHIHGTKGNPVLGHKGKEITQDVHSKNTFYDMTLKYTDTCFYDHISEFPKNHAINKIIFIGLSYGKVDWPYYRYMKDEHILTNDCIGIFYYHSESNWKSARKLCNYLYNLHIINNSPRDEQYFKLDH